MNNIGFLKGGALERALRKRAVAEDIVKNQLGWSQEDMFVEEFNEMASDIRTWGGTAFLSRAVWSNIGQTANPALAFGFPRVLRAYSQMIDPEGRGWEYAREAGAFAIDIMHDYTGSENLPRRILRHMLGSTPEFQSGKVGLKSFIPKRSYLADAGVKSVGWTPFYGVEKFNRAVSALAAKYYAITHLKRMVTNPKRRGSSRTAVDGNCPFA